MGGESKKRIKLLNELLKDNSFLLALAEYSNKDYETLLKYLSMIIGYYLNSDDLNTYDLETLISKAQNLEPSNVRYIMMPSNQAYHMHTMLHGINGEKSKIDDMLTLLSNNISFYGIPHSAFQTSLFQEPTGAVSSTLEYPSILFSDILKRPFNRDDINPSESEKSYYESILDDRLDNVDSINHTKCAKAARRVMKAFIPNKPMMVVIPIDILKQFVDEKDIASGESMSYIPSKYLSYLFLPSKYELLKLCFRKKEKVAEEPEIDYSYGYGRYELLTIDDSFKYQANGLTGDPIYDIDLIYGKGNSDDKRFDRTAPIDENISSIKRNHDINISRMNGYYYISNGRHRILYLINTYRRFKEEAKSQADINYLNKLFAIPLKVVNHIDDKLFNAIIRALASKYRLGIFKNDIRNDEPDVYLSINNVIFHVRSIAELEELYNGLDDSNIKAKYYVGIDINPKGRGDFKILFATLVVQLQERIFDMSFEQILSFISAERINYIELYNEYRLMIDAVTYSKITGIENDYIKRAEKIAYSSGSSTKK